MRPAAREEHGRRLLGARLSVTLRQVRRLILGGGVALATAVVIAASASGTRFANAPLHTLHVVGKPVTIGLPAYWYADKAPAPAVFVAYDPARVAYVDLSITKVGSQSFAEFAAGYAAGSRQYSLSLDPKARVRSQRVTVPAGPTEEVIATLRATSAQGKKEVLSTYAFGVLHDGVDYSFTFVCPAAKLSKYLGTFERAVRSVKIGKS